VASKQYGEDKFIPKSPRVSVSFERYSSPLYSIEN